MAIIQLPTKFGFTRVNKFGLLRATNVLRSRYTGQSQRIVYPFAIWQLEAELVDYDGPEAAAIRAFFAQLEGQKHTFRLPVPGWRRNLAVPAVIGLSQPAAARASSITIGTGANPAWYNRAVFDVGDYFTIQDELKIVTAPAATNATGDAVINFKPALRKQSNGVGIEVANPTVMMHATEDDVASWGLQAPMRHGLSINAIEAVEI